MIKNILLVLAILLGILAAYLVIGRLFPSEQRRLEWTLTDIRKAVESGDVKRCLAFVSPEYNYDKLDYTALEQYSKSLLGLSGAMQIKILKQEAKVLPGNKIGVVASEILSLPCAGSNLPGPIKTSWNLMFRKEGDAWKVWQIELNSVNDQTIGGFKELMRLGQELR